MTEKKTAEVDRFIYKVKAKMTLIALLDGPLHSAELAKRVGMTQQGISRLLMVSDLLKLTTYKKVRGKRINRLTAYGRGIAEQLVKAQEKATPEPQR